MKGNMPMCEYACPNGHMTEKFEGFLAISCPVCGEWALPPPTPHGAIDENARPE